MHGAFLAFAAAHGLAYRPTDGEPHLYATADDVEVAYGTACRAPLPEAVGELMICGGHAPHPLPVVALARAMLVAWPRAQWESDMPAGIARMIAEVAPGRQGRRGRS